MVSQKNSVIFATVLLIAGLVGGFLIGRILAPEIITLQERFLPGEDFNYKLFREVWNTTKEQFVNQPVSNQDLFYGSLKGMVGGLGDPYSVFLPPELATKFAEELAGIFEGIGIEIGIKNNQLTVIAPLPGTPAAQAGLRSGDKILAIDSIDTSGMALDEAVSLIRGEKGTKVTLTISRKTWTEMRDVEIVRGVIDIKTIRWEIKEGKIAYLKISHFSDQTWNDFSKAAREILIAKPQSLILDLRNNPGGYLETAVNIAGYWTGKNLVVISRDGQGNEKEYRAPNNALFNELPTVVLVNQGSASGAEILAGALQDYKLATILGKKTFGKGSVQELETLSDKSALKLTVAYWYTPLMRNINEAGISPDVEVELTEEDYDADRDPQLGRALELLRKE